MANTSQAIRFPHSFQRASELKVQLEESPFPALFSQALLEVFPSGLRRGSIAEIYGVRSSGRSSLALQILAEATRQGEVIAVVDLQNSFSPHAAKAAGVGLRQLVWIRCGGNAEHAIRTCDLLLHAGGFGVVLLDLCDASPRVLNRIPLSYWYRFRRAVENTPTVLLLLSDTPQARATSQQQLQTRANHRRWMEETPLRLLSGMELSAQPGKVSSIRRGSLFFKAVV
jgi:hypothetical protein